MPRKTVNQRLRKVNIRLAGISRRLGYLSGRVFFRVLITGEEVELPITDFRDRGISANNTKAGIEMQAHRFSLQVSRDWVDEFRSIPGEYWIEYEGSRLKCEIENMIIPDQATEASLDLRISQELTI